MTITRLKRRRLLKKMNNNKIKNKELPFCVTANFVRSVPPCCKIFWRIIKKQIESDNFNKIIQKLSTMSLENNFTGVTAMIKLLNNSYCDKYFNNNNHGTKRQRLQCYDFAMVHSDYQKWTNVKKREMHIKKMRYEKTQRMNNY